MLWRLAAQVARGCDSCLRRTGKLPGAWRCSACIIPHPEPRQRQISRALGMPYMWQARSVGMQRVVRNRPARCREKDAAQLIRTIVSVVAHCHHLGVIHRRAACCCMAPCSANIADACTYSAGVSGCLLGARRHRAADAFGRKDAREALLACVPQLMLLHRLMEPTTCLSQVCGDRRHGPCSAGTCAPLTVMQCPCCAGT